MRWGARKQQHGTPCARDQGGGGECARKGKAFSPLSWLAKLVTAKPKGAAAEPADNGGAYRHAPALESGGAGAGAAPSLSACLSKRVGLGLVQVRSSSAPQRSPAEVVPRRLSVGNDNVHAVAARRRCSRPRRHCSLGGDSELPPLGRLIPFSLAGSTARPLVTQVPSDTDAGARVRRRRHRARHHRRSLSGSRRSFSFSSGRMPPRVRVRSPRARRVPELERFAVVRRTRDPQRAFRESMAEMIASSSSSGDVAARPEELERLLACYLSLNADEHHDCIIKVFRQVWFEHLNLLPPRPDHSGRPAGPLRPPRRAALIPRRSIVSKV